MGNDEIKMNTPTVHNGSTRISDSVITLEEKHKLFAEVQNSFLDSSGGDVAEQFGKFITCMESWIEKMESVMLEMSITADGCATDMETIDRLAAEAAGGTLDGM